VFDPQRAMASIPTVLFLRQENVFWLAPRSNGYSLFFLEVGSAPATGTFDIWNKLLL